jgi:hypothetical protein
VTSHAKVTRHLETVVLAKLSFSGATTSRHTLQLPLTAAGRKALANISHVAVHATLSETMAGLRASSVPVVVRGPSPTRCAVRLASKSLTATKTTVGVPVTITAGPCTGTFAIEVQKVVKVTSHANVTRHLETVVLAKLSFSGASISRHTLQLPLTAAGRKALANVSDVAVHATLSESMAGLRASSVPVVVR